MILYPSTKIFKHFLVIVPLLIVTACLEPDKKNDSDKEPTLSLKAEYVGVKEVWLKVTNFTDNLTTEFTIKRDEETLVGSSFSDSDTVVVDNSLQPNTLYEYKAYRLTDGTVADSSDLLQITTMDTISHDFQWDMIEFSSPYGSGALYDVAIIDEDNIWAVGEIYSDSTQPWIPYNAVHWNGERWELKRIQTEYRPDYIITPPIEGIFAFSENDIWISTGSPWHWDGSKWTFYHLWDMGVLGSNDGGVSKIWGVSQSNIYFVGRKGSIVQYNGQVWQKIESGTETTIQDIWGAVNKRTGKWEILCAVSLGYGESDSKILKIGDNNMVDTIRWVPGRAARSVWFDSTSIIYAAGSGVYRKGPDARWREIAGTEVLPVATERVRGIANNDVFVVGHFGAVAHFNGADFRVYPDVTAMIYYSCDYKRNIMVAVGRGSVGAVILKMYR